MFKLSSNSSKEIKRLIWVEGAILIAILIIIFIACAQKGVVIEQAKTKTEITPEPKTTTVESMKDKERKQTTDYQSVKINKNSETRQRQGQYPYLEERLEGATHILGTIHSEIVWTKDKSPYVMDENVFVAEDGSLTIEPGVMVKVVRLTENTQLIDAYVALYIAGKFYAEGTPDEMIHFKALSDNPIKYREWQGIIFLNSSFTNILKWTIVEDSIYGVEATGSPLIAHCLFKNCHNGMSFYNKEFIGDAINNISAFNEYTGCMCFGITAEANISNNIFYKNFSSGIECLWDAFPYADYNLCFWSKDVLDSRKYYLRIEPGIHDLYKDPEFLNPENGDFRLSKTSPARESGHKNSEIGLAIDGWTKDKAEKENQEWLADGARELWYSGLQIERANQIQSREKRNIDQLLNAQIKYETALKKNLPGDLKDKITCSLGRVLVSQMKFNDAIEILKGVVSESEYPHLRDLARKYLAEALAENGKMQEAIDVLKAIEWTQNCVWSIPDIAKYSALGDKPDEALRILESTKKDEPNKYLTTLLQMILNCLERNQLDSAITLCKGFEYYPLAKEAPSAYLSIAKSARKNGKPELAVDLLKKSIQNDPFSKEAPESLSTLADILESDLNRSEEALTFRTQLAYNYLPYNQFVAKAQSEIKFEGTPINKTILLDSSFGEVSTFDRMFDGSCNFGQYDVLCILSKAGYFVHPNDRGGYGFRELDEGWLNNYGLIICNGCYGGGSDPPLPERAIKTLKEYVKNGGNLMVISSGKNWGSGNMANFYNPLIEQFGIQFSIDGYNPDILNTKGVTTNHPAVRGLAGFFAGGGVPVSVKDGDTLGYIDKFPIIALTQFGKGKVIVAGIGSGFMGGYLKESTEPTQNKIARLNKDLLLRLTAYLLSSKDLIGYTQPVFKDTTFHPKKVVTDEQIAFLNTRERERKQAEIFLRNTVGITGKIERQLNENQMMQFIEWLDKSDDPYTEFNKFGGVYDRFWLLYDMFSRLKGRAAKNYLARCFISLTSLDETWPPPEAHFTWLIVAFKEADKIQELEDVAKKFADEHCDNARMLSICAVIGSALNREIEGRQKIVSSYYEDALNLAKTQNDKAQIIAMKARSLQLCRKNSEAIEQYEKAYTLNPKTFVTFGSFIELLGEENQKEKLDAFLPEEFKRYPKDIHVTYDVAGRAYQKMGYFELAEKCFKESLASLPPGYENWNISVRLELAKLYAEQRLNDKAKANAKEALEYVVWLNRPKDYFESVKNEIQTFVDVSELTYEGIESKIKTELIKSTIEPNKPTFIPIRVYPAKYITDSSQAIPDGWEVIKLTHPRGGESNYLVNKSPILTEQHISRVETMEQKEFLKMRLDWKGAEIFRRYSSDAAHHGEPLGIGIKVGDRWVSFPIIQDEISVGIILIPNLTEDEIKQVLDAYRAPPPPPYPEK